MSFLNQVAQNWTQNSICGFTRVKRMDHLYQTLGNSLLVQPIRGFFGKNMLLGHVQFCVHSNFFCQAAFQLSGPQQSFVPSQLNDFVFSMAEFHEASVSPFLQPFELSLNGIITINVWPLLPILHHLQVGVCVDKCSVSIYSNCMLVCRGAQLFKSSVKKDTTFLVCMIKKNVYNFIEPVIFLIVLHIVIQLCPIFLFPVN